MLNPVTFRFLVRSAIGLYRKTVLRDATRILNKGFRLALTPERICDEMTLTARNGPSPSNPDDLGLGLNPLDLVTVQFATTQMPAESDWLTVYYGEVRQGGNPYDYLGEDMVLRGLSTRLRETPTVEKAYPSMDGGALVRQLVLDTLASGLLGSVIFPSLSIPPSPEGPTDTRVVHYDASAIPDLNFTMSISPSTNGQPLGTLLDTIQATALSAGVECRWGVRPDGVLTFLPVLDVEMLWPAQMVEWKPPVTEVVYTAVQWSIAKRPDGTYLKYLSVAPEASTYGTRAKPEAVGPDLKVWQPATGHAQFGTLYGPTPAGSDSNANLRDGDPRTSVSLSNPMGPSTVNFILDVACDRLYVDMAQATTPPSVFVAYPDGGTVTLLSNDPGGVGFIKAQFLADVIGPRGLPAGSSITLITYPNTTGGASSMTVTAFHADTLNRTLLDGLARYHYQLPVAAPGDLYVPGLLPPDQFGGRIRTPRSNGQEDYTARVALWEYTVSGAQGILTAAKTGQPNTPEREAAIALTRKGDTLATAAALDVA